MEISKSIQTLEQGELSIERYLDSIKSGLAQEIERIVREEQKIGEGRASKVFDISMKKSPCLACVKIWRPELKKLRAQDPIGYKKIQYLEPEEEFHLQDELYLAGFNHIPRPLAYTEIDGYYALAMERIPGHTFKEIQEAGAKITDPKWQSLERLLFSLNVDHHVVHRDLGNSANIILKTDQNLEENKEVKGEIYLIDFGLSKRISGDRPTPDDFELTLGNNVIKYPQDLRAIEKLKPAPRGAPISGTFRN